MLCASSSLPLLGSASAMCFASSSRFVGLSDRTALRYDHVQSRLCSWNGIEKKKMNQVRTASASGYPLFLNQLKKDSPRPKTYKEITKSARQMFAREISIQSKDSEISIAKVYKKFLLSRYNPSDLSLDDLHMTIIERKWALLYIAAEDETFLAFNQDIDAQSVIKEWESAQDKSDVSEAETVQDSSETDSEELLQLGGKSLSHWLNELDAISKEVEAELVAREISCHSTQVLEAVNAVFFDSRGFKRTSITVELENTYLHSVLTCRCGTAFLLSVVYIEVCTRLGVPIVGSPVGEDFLIWPTVGYPEELFKVTSGEKSLFAIVNGRCVDDPASMASDLTAKSLEDLDIATNRDIIGIALANLIRFHWRRASKSSPGLMLTAPLSQLNNISSINFPMLRPQELRLAIAAAERLLILQPHNWAFRRDLGMMLYFERQYGEAIQELSICVAFVPDEEEAKVLESFIERLHLLRLISSLKPLDSDRLTVA